MVFARAEDVKEGKSQHGAASDRAGSDRACRGDDLEGLDGERMVKGF